MSQKGEERLLARRHLTTELRWEFAARLCRQTKTTGGGLRNGRLGSVFNTAAKLQTSSGLKEAAAQQKPSAVRGKLERCNLLLEPAKRRSVEPKADQNLSVIQGFIIDNAKKNTSCKFSVQKKTVYSWLFFFIKGL